MDNWILSDVLDTTYGSESTVPDWVHFINTLKDQHYKLAPEVYITPYEVLCVIMMLEASRSGANIDFQKYIIEQDLSKHFIKL